MTTYPTIIKDIRRLLNDTPLEDKVTTAPTTTAGTTMVVATIGSWRKGQWWEFQDGDTTGAEVIYVDSVEESTSTPTIRRAFKGSTAATHSDNAYAALEPRFTYDKTKQAVDTVLDRDLYANDVYAITTHQVNYSSSSWAYAAPAATCERLLNIYQVPEAGDDPVPISSYSPYTNGDTTIWATGKRFSIYENYSGTSGIYYVNCAHKLAIGTLSTAQEKLVQCKAAAYLLEWEEPRRAAGPTNQGDQTVRVGDQARLAAYYNDQFMRGARDEAAYLKRLTPSRRWFKRGT